MERDEGIFMPKNSHFAYQSVLDFISGKLSPRRFYSRAAQPPSPAWVTLEGIEQTDIARGRDGDKAIYSAFPYVPLLPNR
jgi:hypothetical protein